MAVSLPYLPSNKNLPTLLEKIAVAKVPDTLSQTVLAKQMGLKGSGDRPLIPLLRTLGILDASNKPTARYHLLRNKGKAKQALAEAIREAYRPLFDADENAHRRGGDELKGLIAQVAGTDEGATNKIAWTFGVLVKLADFTPISDGKEEDEEKTSPDASSTAPPLHTARLRTDFHYNIQIHLPANATEETYLNIFNAVRRVFQ